MFQLVLKSGQFSDMDLYKNVQTNLNLNVHLSLRSSPRRNVECSYNCFAFTKLRNLTMKFGSEAICTVVDGASVKLFLAACCNGFTTPARFGNHNSTVHGCDVSFVFATSYCHPIRGWWCGRMDIIRSAARESAGLCSMGSQPHDLRQRHIA